MRPYPFLTLNITIFLLGPRLGFAATQLKSRERADLTVSRHSHWRRCCITKQLSALPLTFWQASVLSHARITPRAVAHVSFTTLSPLIRGLPSLHACHDGACAEDPPALARPALIRSSVKTFLIVACRRVPRGQRDQSGLKLSPLWVRTRSPDPSARIVAMSRPRPLRWMVTASRRPSGDQLGW